MSYAVRTQAFHSLSSKDEINKTIVKTKMCQETMKGKKCYRKGCGFAHSKDELSLPMCLFDHTCRLFNAVKPCTHVHSCENAESYKARTNLPWPLDIVVPPLRAAAKMAPKSETPTTEEDSFMLMLCKKHDMEMSSHPAPVSDSPAPVSDSPAPVSDSPADDEYPIVIVNSDEKMRYEATVQQQQVQQQQVQPTCDVGSATVQQVQPVESVQPQYAQPIYYNLPVVTTRNVNVYFSIQQFAVIFHYLNELGVFFQTSGSGVHAILRSDQFATLFPYLIRLGVSFQTE